MFKNPGKDSRYSKCHSPECFTHPDYEPLSTEVMKNIGDACNAEAELIRTYPLSELTTATESVGDYSYKWSLHLVDQVTEGQGLRIHRHFLVQPGR